MILFVDLEVYRNYFLAKFMTEDGRFREFEQYEDNPLDSKGLYLLLTNPKVELVSFNGNNYDLPILSYVTQMAPSNSHIKAVSDEIINGGRPYQLYRNLGFQPIQVNHIDVIEPAPGVNTSLKIYAGRLHAKKMQDLPIEPDALIDANDRALLREYCGNDLVNTQLLYNAVKKRIDLRRSLTDMVGIDVRSKSDAQIAEVLLSKRIGDARGRPVEKVKTTIKSFKYEPPAYIRFHTPLLQDVLEKAKSVEFEVDHNGYVQMPEVIDKLDIRIGVSKYKLGIGGLHSQEECVTYYSNDQFKLIDNDVTSYYPNLMLNLGRVPFAMGELFLTEYQKILDERVLAKRREQELKSKIAEFDTLPTSEAVTIAVDRLNQELVIENAKNEGGKIQANGTFGKTSSKYSVLYNPMMTLYTTLTGQLSLLMLIEAFERFDISVISANTDGVVAYCTVSKTEGMKKIVAAWEKCCNLQMEETRYKSVHSRDVNNYIAIKENGEVKTKGIFAETGLMKTPQNEICVNAVIAYLKDGTPVEDTVRACTDIRQFVTVRRVNGGAVWKGEEIGKAVRWYYAVGETGTLNYKTNGNTVPRTKSAKPCMELPDEFPNDVNYDWYVKECNELLMDIGVVERPVMPKIPRKNSKEWKALLESGKIELNEEGKSVWVTT